MVTSNTFPCTKAEKGAELLLLRTERIDKGLSLSFSLYRLTLQAGIFYLASVEDLRAGSASLAVIGSDREEAESIYLRLVKGNVPPSTLREIVFDLCESQEYAEAFR